jgi:hypothetical protein
MPYKRKKWSPFTASADYSREQKDDFYDIIKEREEKDSKDAAKRNEDMYTHGLGIEAQEGGGSVWKKIDDKKKKKKKTIKEINADPNIKQQVYLFGNPKLRVGSFKKKK